MVQSKIGRRVTLLTNVADENGDRMPLYPELEELAFLRAVRIDGVEVIGVEERNGKPNGERRMSSVHRAISPLP